jgi:hypothetical protein
LNLEERGLWNWGGSEVLADGFTEGSLSAGFFLDP